MAKLNLYLTAKVHKRCYNPTQNRLKDTESVTEIKPKIDSLVVWQYIQTKRLTNLGLCVEDLTLSGQGKLIMPWSLCKYIL